MTRELPAPDAGMDVGDMLAATRFGEPLLAALNPGSDKGEASARAGMQALIAALEQLRLAIQAGQPATIRRRSGLFGRLLGRDVEIQLQAEQLAQQLGVLLIRTDALATTLAAQAATRSVEAPQIAVDAIERWIAAGQTWLGRGGQAWNAALAQRLDHLRRLTALHRLDVERLTLLDAQVQDLLARYGRIRDVLLPAWRQQASVQATRDDADRHVAVRQAEHDIAAEVLALQSRLR